MTAAAAGAPVAERLRIGDLVVCASKSFRAQAGLGLEVGLFLVERRRDALVHFGGPDRSAWIPKDTLKAVRPDDPRVVPPPAWVVRLNRAVRLVEAKALELERGDGGEVAARIACAGLDLPTLRELESLAGSEAPGLRIRPGSMSKVVVVFPVGAAPARDLRDGA